MPRMPKVPKGQNTKEIGKVYDQFECCISQLIWENNSAEWFVQNDLLFFSAKIKLQGI